jgi:uncharacterized damage-inducible protein DinB
MRRVAHLLGMMISRDYCVTLAQYNAWMNRKLYALCSALTDETRKADMHAFFRSIDGTLNHILAVDQMFLSHFREDTPRYLPEGLLLDDFEVLRQRREVVDADLLAWSATVSPEWLAERTSFAHGEDGTPRNVERGFWVVQMFNHQTHHRGQVTTLLTQLGHDIGSTDLHTSVPGGD